MAEENRGTRIVEVVGLVALVGSLMFGALMMRVSDADWSALEPVDRFRVSAFYRMSFRFYEDAQYQFRLGNLDPELWAGWKGGLTSMLESRAPLGYWSREQTRFSAPFRALVDSIIAAQ